MKTFAFRSLPQWLGAPPKIDRENAIIYGVTAMQVGEAMGHGVWADHKTLQMMVELANSKPKGVAGRWGHPGASENTMGKKVQIAKNFRIEGDNLRHDAHLWKPARKSAAFSQDPLEYLMDVAEQDPGGIGESVVIQTDTVWTLTDGREISTERELSPADVHWDLKTNRPINATTLLPVMRPASFHFVDFVSEGALTPNGLFSTESQFFVGHSSEYAQELFDLVDRWRAAYSVPLSALPQKVTDLMERYINSRGELQMARKNVQAQAVVENPLYEELQAEELDTEEFENNANQADEAAPETELAYGTDLLDRAEQIASEFAQVGDVTQFATTAQYQELANNFARLSAEIERMKDLLVKNLEATAVLNRNLKRIESEPVVTLKVPTTNPLEMKFSHPEPKATIAEPGALTQGDDAKKPVALNHRQQIAQLQQQRKPLVRRPGA